ncbi:hypothetical protein CLTEP_06170 [Clostridium tepidiprofundi DSM 19306]|uniref:Uncharacterized protein n=1 Tax=Clostridium tepidiprofundi DSM 19306 TaxID=1121338 RepID=A0A151B675_9CLOT|nr:hypothetical protein [Clostridium tepidiprofundi]KYH35441.1 hypothetical protein CLTEP_06170 [Clostridium tepidiprofundi DSM 19306]
MKNKKEDNFKKAYIELLTKLQTAVNNINASDYSKKSLGRFKEKVEKIVYEANEYIKN